MDEFFLTERFHEALAVASRTHACQNRKGSKIPYVSHLLGVCSIVLKAGGCENQAIAALLHDAIEDQEATLPASAIKDLFGEEVLAMVLDCTDETQETRKTTSWQARKQAYLAHLPSISQNTRLVVLADKLDNLRDISREHREMGDRVWQKFSGKQEGTRQFYLDFLKILGDWQGDFQQQNNTVAVHLIDEFASLCQKLFDV